MSESINDLKRKFKSELFDEDAEITILPLRQWMTVGELTDYLQDLISEDPLTGGSIVLKGELSNVNRSSRGHIYFTLKDDAASIKGALWAGVSRRIKFDLQDGLEVFITGRVEIYKPSGTYSLIVESMEPVGVGALQLAFEQTKAKLDAAGFFLADNKKPIPTFPMSVALITSPTGSVIHDMLRVIRRKNPLIDVLVVPVKVQGEGAGDEIAGALDIVNRLAEPPEMIILARGGGSFEDLFCFSDEAVVKAIFRSHIPVITGIGHEPDYSLADAAADYSASTPTAAAEHGVPDIIASQATLGQYRTQLVKEMADVLLNAEQGFDQTTTLWLNAVTHRFSSTEHQLVHYRERLAASGKQAWEKARQQLASSAQNLNTFSPLNTLSRGYAVATDSNGAVLNKVSALQPGTRFNLKVSDGSITAEVTS